MHEDKVVTTPRVDIIGDGTDWAGRLWLYSVEPDTKKRFPEAALFMDRGLLKFQLYGQQLIGGTEGIFTGGPLLSASLELRHDGTLLLQPGAKLATHDINGLGKPYANPLIGRDDNGVCQIGTVYGPAEISASEKIKINIAGDEGEVLSTLDFPALDARYQVITGAAELTPKQEKAARIREAIEAMAPLDAAVSMDIATEDETALLEAVKVYLVQLRRLDVSVDGFVWPTSPLAGE